MLERLEQGLGGRERGEGELAGGLAEGVAGVAVGGGLVGVLVAVTPAGEVLEAAAQGEAGGVLGAKGFGGLAEDREGELNALRSRRE